MKDNTALASLVLSLMADDHKYIFETISSADELLQLDSSSDDFLDAYDMVRYHIEQAAQKLREGA